MVKSTAVSGTLFVDPVVNCRLSKRAPSLRAWFVFKLRPLFSSPKVTVGEGSSVTLTVKVCVLLFKYCPDSLSKTVDAVISPSIVSPNK